MSSLPLPFFFNTQAVKESTVTEIAASTQRLLEQGQQKQHSQQCTDNSCQEPRCQTGSAVSTGLLTAIAQSFQKK